MKFLESVICVHYPITCRKYMTNLIYMNITSTKIEIYVMNIITYTETKNLRQNSDIFFY